MRWPIESAHTWPVRSISSAELIATTWSFLRMQRGVVGAVAGMELDERVVVDEVEEPLRADHEAGDDAPRVHVLPAVGDRAGLDEVDDAVGEHLGVDAEVVLVGRGARAPRRGWRRCPSAASRRRPPGGPRCSPMAPRPAVGGRGACACSGRSVCDERGEPIDVDQRVAVRARHALVDLGDDVARRVRGGQGRVDRRAERAVAVAVGRRELDQRDVERRSPATEQPRDVGEEDRDEVGAPLRRRPRAAARR